MLPFLLGISMKWRFGAFAQSTTFIGGLPLRLPGPCPSNLVSGQVTFEQNCCAANQTFVKEEASVCCPDENDCYSEVEEAARCADPTWQLCDSGIGFCCFQGWTCYTQLAVSGNGSGVGCSTPGATLNALQSEVPTVAGEPTGPSSISPSSSASAAKSTSTATIVPSPSSVMPTAAPSEVSLSVQSTTASRASSSTAHITSSPGLNSAQKIGMGTGISLGFLLLAVIASLIYILRRHKRSSQQHENDNYQIPTDFDIDGDPASGSDGFNARVDENKGNVLEQDRLMQEVHELHDTGQGSPRELQGSPAPRRRELL